MNTSTFATCLLQGSTLSVKISGEIDHHTVREVRKEIDAALYTNRPKKVCIDLSDMRFMDSSGLGLIVGRVASAKEVGATVKITGASERTRHIFEMAGLFRMEGLYIDK